MNGFVGTSLFLKIALVFDMETAFSHSSNRIVFKISCFRISGIRMNNLTHDKLPWASRVVQKSQTKSVYMKKLCEEACITVTTVFETMLPDDISTPHTESFAYARTHAYVYLQTDIRICGQIIIRIVYNEPKVLPPSYFNQNEKSTF